jgi:hypothetical protein
MVRAMKWTTPLVLGLLVSGCQPTQLGQCDEALAKTLVFDLNGNPAYAGQAMVEQACAGCHSAQSTGASRRGAPHGLDFDMVGSRDGTAAMPDMAAIDRVAAAQLIIFEDRFDMFDTVVDGSMPPGEIGMEAYVDAGYQYEDGRPLERIESAAGQEIYREWLACNGPVVERTDDPPMGMEGADCMMTAEVGDCVYRSGGAEPVPPMWSVIHARIVARCAIPACHASDTDGAGLNLTDAAASRAAMVDQPAGTGGATPMCMGMGTRIVPGNPEMSIFWNKVSDPTPNCGLPMPVVGARLSTRELAAVEQWIMMGAPDN